MLILPERRTEASERFARDCRRAAALAAKNKVSFASSCGCYWFRRLSTLATAALAATTKPPKETKVYSGAALQAGGQKHYRSACQWTDWWLFIIIIIIFSLSCCSKRPPIHLARASVSQSVSQSVWPAAAAKGNRNSCRVTHGLHGVHKTAAGTFAERWDGQEKEKQSPQVARHWCVIFMNH